MALVGAANNLVNEDLAGEKGFEPLHAGIKIQCLNQLGDSPTRVDDQRHQPIYVAPDRKRPDFLDRPAHKGMNSQIAALANLPALRGHCQFDFMRHFCKHRTP